MVHNPSTFHIGTVHTQVLILGERHTDGLDLSFVTHIVAVDEIWDRAKWQQLIARANRIGATRPVQVVHLVARGTVEEDMLEINRRETAKGAWGQSSLQTGLELLTRLRFLRPSSSMAVPPLCVPSIDPVAATPVRSHTGKDDVGACNTMTQPSQVESDAGTARLHSNPTSPTAARLTRIAAEHALEAAAVTEVRHRPGHDANNSKNVNEVGSHNTICVVTSSRPSDTLNRPDPKRRRVTFADSSTTRRPHKPHMAPGASADTD